MEIVKNELDKRSDIIAHLDKSMLVEAGAGAGKTRLVVTRNVEQLKKGVLTANQLVDITFTNAAAEELRTRLLDALHSEVDNLQGEERTRIENAIKDESLIQISTIHSFCKRLLTEQSFAAKLPMDFTLLDDSEATERKVSFFAKWYREQDEEKLLNIEKNYYRGNVGEAIQNTFLKICELPDDTIFHYDDLSLSEGDLSDYTSRIKKRLRKIFECVLIAAQDTMPRLGYKTIDDVCNTKDTKGRSIANSNCCKVWDALKNTDYTNADQDLINDYKGLLEEKQTYNTNIKKLFYGNSIPEFDYRRNKEINHSSIADEKFQSILGGEKNLTIELERYQNALVVDMALRAREAYRTFCKLPENRHVITNDGLLQEALELVKNDTDARRYFQSKFSCIYVDEFQDTDLVQRELVEILCQDPDDPTKKRPGSLFFVGDPKQSIYAFRGADVDVYLDYKEANSSPDVDDLEEYILDDNYRSEKPIIDWVNDYFENRFNNESGTGDIKYSRMNHKNDNSDEKNIIRGVYTLNYPNWVLEKGKPYVYDNKIAINKDIDSKLLTNLISHLVSEHFKIWDKKRDGSGMELRDVQYRDFLVLCLIKKDINLYANQLKEVGIPTNLCGAIDHNNDEILLRVMQLLKYLSNPYSNWLADLGARSVLVGGRVTKENEEEGRKRLEYLRKYTTGMNANEILQFIVHHPEYLLKDNVTGAEIAMAQSRLQQMLEAVQASPSGDLKEIVAQIQRYMNTGSDRELLLEKDQDAVRLMNLHKAKGLEGKIVIICARNSRSNIKDGDYRYMRDYYPFAGKGNTGIASYLGDETISVLAKNKVEKERLRQDYVEATRAEEALIFMDALKDKAIFNDCDFSAATNILELSSDLQKDVLSIYDNPDMELSQEFENEADYDDDTWRIKSVPEQKKNISRSITPSGMETGTAWKPGEESNRPYSSTFGTVMHRCFELMITMIRNKLELDVEAVIKQAIMESYSEVILDGKEDQTPDEIINLYIEYLTDRLTLFLSEESLQQKIVDAKEVYTELSFSEYASKDEICKVNKKLGDNLQYDDETPYWINGKADLVIVNDDRVEIIDYKSDHIGSKSMEEFRKHLSDTYDLQQELYRFALSQMLGIAIDQVSYSYYHLYSDRV